MTDLTGGRQTSFTQAHKTLFPNTGASVLLVTIEKKIMYIYVFLYNFSLCFVNSSLEVTFRIALEYDSERNKSVDLLFLMLLWLDGD